MPQLSRAEIRAIAEEAVNKAFGVYYDTVASACERTGLSESTVRAGIRSGALEARRIAGRWLLPMGWENALAEDEAS